MNPATLRPYPPLRSDLERLAETINESRERQGGGYPPCGQHAVGKPTHQAAAGCRILIVGEAPASDGWWITGRAFYRRSRAGHPVLSQTGVNLNACLAVLRTTIDQVAFIEAVHWRPDRSRPWRPGDPDRRRRRPFLEKHLLVTEPRLVLPLGLVAAASCLEAAFGWTPATLEPVVGRAWVWPAPWGTCAILPLYHPSPANGARWPCNRTFLCRFLRRNPAVVVPSLSGTGEPTYPRL